MNNILPLWITKSSVLKRAKNAELAKENKQTKKVTNHRQKIR